MTHYNDIYDPMLDALDEDEQEFRTRAFTFLYQFFDEGDDDGFTNVKSTPERRKLAEDFLAEEREVRNEYLETKMGRHRTMFDDYENTLYDEWMTKYHPEERGESVNWWAEGTSYAGIEDVFPRHFRECISSLLPELRIALYEKFQAEYKS